MTYNVRFNRHLPTYAVTGNVRAVEELVEKSTCFPLGSIRDVDSEGRCSKEKNAHDNIHVWGLCRLCDYCRLHTCTMCTLCGAYARKHEFVAASAYRLNENAEIRIPDKQWHDVLGFALRSSFKLVSNVKP